MRWEALPINTTFDRARRQEAYRRITGLVRRGGERRLLPLDDLTRRVRIFEQNYVGIHPIAVSRIVGTAGRSEDFDKDFLPLRPEARGRWMRVERSFSTGEFPPIVVYQLGESYFVVDGHHRVAIAKQRKVEYIDAEITRLHARFELPDDVDVGRLILAEQHQLFMEESGLERARPEASIRFNRPDRYVELLELIKAHGFDLIKEQGRMLSTEEIAASFYDRVYLPTIEAIRREGLLDACPEDTEADIFLWIYARRRALFAEQGRADLDEVVLQKKQKHRTRDD